jgi:formyl-CoA transferase
MPSKVDDAHAASTSDARQGPLRDIRVIEMGQLLAGPFCGQILADFGADVIKCEQPGVGDPMREWGREKTHGKSLWWPVVARNKKSITLNLRTTEAHEIVKSLVATSDVLVENFRPGTLERWGLGYDVLSKINPQIVMVRVTGFGQTGPYSERAGYGAIGEAMGGLRYVVGDPSSPPSRVGISIGDELAAIYAALGAMAAIHARTWMGRGQVVDSAIYEAVLAMMESLVTEYDQAGYIRERTGAILPNVSPSNVYPTDDGRMILIAANQDTVFKRLGKAMGCPELAADSRFATHAARGRNQQELDELISDWTRSRRLEDVEEILNSNGVPCGRIYRAPDMMADRHFIAREAIVSVAHPDFGTLRMQNVTPKFSATPGVIRHAGPALGEHNDDVFRGILKMPDEVIADYMARGII